MDEKITEHIMSIKITDYLIKKDDTIADAFIKMNINKCGVVFVTDEDGKVCGIATDGDIRGKLLKKHTVDSRISECMNVKFVFASATESRENILKMLDHVIKTIPVLDREGKLLDVVTTRNFPLEAEKNVIARSKSPVRISFGGGGTDLTHYFMDNGGVVLNATIGMYAHASLRKRPDSKVIINSHDLNKRIEVDHIQQISNVKGFELISSAIQLINPRFGFELELYSDFPVGSGLGGSSVVLSTIFGCFNLFRADRWDNYEVAEMAFQAERITLGIAGGWQDQYATVFGGFNFMEFEKNSNVVHPLRVPKRTLLELEENLILCHSKQTRNSGDIHDDQKKEYDNKDKDIESLSSISKQLTFDMKTDLLRGRVHSFARRLDEVWEVKKKYSTKISNKYLDEIYACAKENGALGGKLLGAGGGGYFLFYVDPFKKQKVIKALEAMGAETKSVLFDNEGLQSWTVREE